MFIFSTKEILLSSLGAFFRHSLIAQTPNLAFFLVNLPVSTPYRESKDSKSFTIEKEYLVTLHVNKRAVSSYLYSFMWLADWLYDPLHE